MESRTELNGLLLIISKEFEAALILIFFLSFLIDLKSYLQQRSNKGKIVPEEAFVAINFGKRASCGREEEKRMEKIRKIKRVPLSYSHSQLLSI